MNAYAIFSQVIGPVATLCAGVLASASLRLVTYRDPVRPVEVRHMFKSNAVGLRLLGVAVVLFTAFVCWAGMMPLFEVSSPHIVGPSIIIAAMLVLGFRMERKWRLPPKWGVSLGKVK
jgi:hypothetical protein